MENKLEAKIFRALEQTEEFYIMKGKDTQEGRADVDEKRMT